MWQCVRTMSCTQQMLALLLFLLQLLLWSSGHLCNPRMKSESESEVAQSYLTLCNPRDCSLPGFSFVHGFSRQEYINLPGSSIHGIFQARILEWVAIFFSRWSSQPRDQTLVSRITGRRFTLWANRESTGWTFSKILEYKLAAPVLQLCLCLWLKDFWSGCKTCKRGRDLFWGYLGKHPF